jgi:hypothetical protein
VVVAGRLQNPLLLHDDLVQFLLHLLLPHLYLQIHVLALLHLLQRPRFLRQLRQTVAQEITHLSTLTHHRIPE